MQCKSLTWNLLSPSGDKQLPWVSNKKVYWYWRIVFVQSEPYCIEFDIYHFTER